MAKVIRAKRKPDPDMIIPPVHSPFIDSVRTALWFTSDDRRRLSKLRQACGRCANRNQRFLYRLMSKVPALRGFTRFVYAVTLLSTGQKSGLDRRMPQRSTTAVNFS